MVAERQVRLVELADRVEELTGVLAPTSYGPAAAAMAVYVGAGQYLPVVRTAAVLATLTAMSVSTDWLGTQRGRAAWLTEARLLPHVRSLLRTVGVLHVDKTPGRVAGTLSYSTSPKSEFLTAMHVGRPVRGNHRRRRHTRGADP